MPGHCDQAYHMFYLLFSDLNKRSKFIKFMKKKGISCVFHYVALNDTPMGNNFGWMRGDCPVAEK